MTPAGKPDGVKYAAFFRNLNLGRPNCPSKAQLEAAFISAGASAAASFLTNGTVVFTVKSEARAMKVLALARQILQAECGLREPAYIRSIDYLAGLVALDLFAAIERGDVYECCISFLHADSVMPAALPLESKRRDLEIFHCTGSEALSVSRKIGSSPGSPNAFLEKLLGLPATTRSWNTVRRLVLKHG
ncbi:DUF1697 domain-containing protein [Collimonas fungivorans]|nr:DUF1697 domain-containing protein [Collimonas fungivorans]